MIIIQRSTLTHHQSYHPTNKIQVNDGPSKRRTQREREEKKSRRSFPISVPPTSKTPLLVCEQLKGVMS